LQAAPGLQGIGGLAHQPEAVVAGSHKLLGFGVVALGEEGIDAAQQELLFAGEGVDRAEHAGPLTADQLGQFEFSFDSGGDGDVDVGVTAAQTLNIGEGVFLGGLPHRQRLPGEGGELIATPVVQELMQQQGPLGALTPVGQRCFLRKAETPAAVEQILHFALQTLGRDRGIEGIGRQPEAGQLGVLGGAVALQLLLKQGLELTKAPIAGLLQGQGDVAVGEVWALEQLLHLVGLQHLTQEDAGPIHELDVEDAAGPDQFQQHGAPLGLLAIGQVNEQWIGQILGHKWFQLAAQLVEAGSCH
jgi:hypothetical protein